MPFPLLTAAAPIIGGAVSAIGGYLTNRSEQNFAERMSGTAYQRAMKDMQEAGLNPMLAFSQGGASTPSPNLENPLRGMGDAATSAVRMSKIEKPKVDSEIKYNESAAKAQDAQEQATRYQGIVNLNTALRVQAETERIKADTAVSWEDAKKRIEETGLTRAQKERARFELSKAQLESKMFSGLNAALGDAPSFEELKRYALDPESWGQLIRSWFPWSDAEISPSGGRPWKGVGR